MSVVVRVVVALGLGGVAACLAPAETTCGDGKVCPGGSTCASGGDCASDALVAACDGAGKEDGDPCAVGGVENGACAGGICTPVSCGNGVVASPEDCEPGDLAGATCADVGFYAGELACGAACRFDTSGCVGSCGDGIVDAVEACDSIVQVSCAAYGFDAGRPACSDACDVDVSGCVTIGVEPSLTADATLTGLWVAPTGAAFAIGDDALFARHGLDVDELETPDQPKDAGTWRTIDGCDDDDVWAARRRFAQIGIVTTFAHFHDGAWDQAGDGVLRDVGAMACTAAGVVFTSVPSQFDPAEPLGAMHRYDGTTLVALAPVERTVHAVAATEDGIEVATDDGLWRLGDAGWTQVALPGVELLALHARGARRWAGDASGALHSFDGASWQTAAYADAAITSIAVLGTTPIVRSSSGKVWQRDAVGRVQLAVDASIAAIASDGTTLHVLAGGGLGTITTDWVRVAYVPAGARPFIASDGALWTFGSGATRDGETILVGDDARGIWEAPAGTIWIDGTFDRYKWEAGVLTSRAPQPGFIEDIRGVAGGDYDHYFRLRFPFSDPPSRTGQVQLIDGDDESIVIGSGVLGLWGPGDGTAYAVGAEGLVMYFDGAAWATLDLGVSADLNDVWGTGPDAIDVVGADGVYRHWDGSTWSTPADSLGATLRRVRADGGAVRALTSSGRLYAADALGWTPVRGVVGATELAMRGDEVFALTPSGLRVLRRIEP